MEPRRRSDWHRHRLEGVAHLTFVGTQPCSLLLTSLLEPRSLVPFVVVAWCLQGSLIGLLVAAAAHHLRMRTIASAMTVLAAEVSIPGVLVVLFASRSGSRIRAARR